MQQIEKDIDFAEMVPRCPLSPNGSKPQKFYQVDF